MEVKAQFDVAAARAFYEAHRDADVPPPLDETFEQFCERTKDQDWRSLYAKGEPAGAVIFEGPQVHAAVLRKHRGRCMVAILACLRQKLTENGILFAPVHPKNHTVCNVLDRLGFIIYSETPDVRLYWRCP